MERIDREATKRAALWDLLADCLRRGLERSERIEFLPDHRGVDGKGEPRDVIRLHWRNIPERSVPELHLDADADPVILDAVLPGAKLTRVALRPNADVVQVTDKTFSNAALKQPGVRAEAAALVAAEAFADRLRGGAGTLAAATKKAVRAIFEDAGLVAREMPGEDADRIMRETPLHGARWAWFGPGLLGLNAYERMTTVVVLGREEMPLGALEAQARALFGDEGEPIHFVEPDDKGRFLTPETPLAYTMEDGSGAGVVARAHPDPRARALQLQGREANTWQTVERLRLARATIRKRVVIACKIPVPSLPVTALTTWDALAPGRIQSALVEAGGMLRLGAKGLHEDAPREFGTVKAAERFLEGAGITPHAANRVLLPARGVIANVARIRLKGQAGAKGTLALLAVPGDPWEAATARWGELAAFELNASADVFQNAARRLGGEATATPAAVGAPQGEQAPRAERLPAAASAPHPPDFYNAQKPAPPPPAEFSDAQKGPERGRNGPKEEMRRLHEGSHVRRDPPGRVVASVLGGAPRPGAVAVKARLGVSDAYWLIARLVELGCLARAGDGVLSVPPDAPEPPYAIPAPSPGPSYARPALTWPARRFSSEAKAPEDCTILTPEQQRAASVEIEAARRRRPALVWTGARGPMPKFPAEGRRYVVAGGVVRPGWAPRLAQRRGADHAEGIKA